MDRRGGVAEHFIESRPAIFQRSFAQIFVANREQIPRNVRSRSLFREKLHTRCRRMNSEEQRFEVESRRADDHDLAIDDAALRQRRLERRDELRKVTVHRPFIAALKQDLIAVAKDERAESVPFRLEQPAVACRQAVGRRGQHRSEWRIKRKMHDARPCSEAHGPSRSSPDRHRAFPRGSAAIDQCALPCRRLR